MLTENLPIYRETYKLLGMVTDLIDAFPRKYKFVIGQTLMQETIDAFRYISYANRSRTRRGEYIEEFLARFDNEMSRLTNGNYGRYVDDFYCVSADKKYLLSLLPIARSELKRIGITLHPHKVYIQEARKGVKFIGSVIKQGRVYAGKQTVCNAKVAIDKYNKLVEKEGDKDAIAEKFMATMNSYLGFMRHTMSYSIKYRLWNRISLQIKCRCYAREHFNKICIRKTLTGRSKTYTRIQAQRRSDIQQLWACYN